MDSQIDYSTTGLSITRAMIDDYERHPRRPNGPGCIRWGPLFIQQSDRFPAPNAGIVEAEFLEARSAVKQGFDLKVDRWIQLEMGERISVLRTWKDDKYENFVSYPYESREGAIWIWNVYERILPNGCRTEEVREGNCGFWIEHKSDTERVYHCSHGQATPPDFDMLVFAVRVKPS